MLREKVQGPCAGGVPTRLASRARRRAGRTGAHSPSIRASRKASHSRGWRGFSPACPVPPSAWFDRLTMSGALVNMLDAAKDALAKASGAIRARLLCGTILARQTIFLTSLRAENRLKVSARLQSGETGPQAGQEERVASARPDQMVPFDRKGLAQKQRVGACQNRKRRATFLRTCSMGVPS